MLITLLSFSGLKAQENIVDQVIWVIGDEAIYKSSVEHARLQMLARGERIEGDPYCLIPEQLAVQKLFLDQAKIDSIAVSSADINRSLARYENNVISSLGSREKVEEYLGSSILKLREEWREQISNDYLVGEAKKNVVGKINLSPSEVQKYYNQLSKDSLPYIPTSVEVQIITREPAIPLVESDRVKDRLRSYIDRINKGENFSTLAIMYSEDPGSAQNGGELGFMGRAQLVPEFANVAFSLSDPAKVSNIVESEYGYHIIQLIERRGDRINVRHILLRPNVPQDVINLDLARLDTLSQQIKGHKFTFEDATILSSDKETFKNNGLMVNQNAENSQGVSSRFRMDELPSEIAKVIDTMKIGEVSAPFRMKFKSGKEGVAIVKLKNKIDGHIANVSDDYQALKVIVENKRKEEILAKWVQKKIKDIYVNIDKDWRNCDFKYPDWVKEK